MIHILGNSKAFIEIDDSNIEMDLVPLRLCIDGNIIGTLETGTYMPSFIGALKEIIENDYYQIDGVDDSNFKDIFYKDGVLCDNFRVTFEESFDDFSRRVLRNKNSIYFTSFLYVDHYFDYPELKVNEVIFSKCTYNDLLNLINLLSNWWKNKKSGFCHIKEL